MSIPWCLQLPHLDRLIKRSRNEIFSIWRKSNRVNGIFVSIWPLETLNQVASSNIPNANRLVERSGSDEAGIWRNGNSGDAILDAERHNVSTSLDIPQTDGTVTRSRSDGTSISGKVEGVNILLVTREGIPDLPLSNIPDTDKLVLSTSSEVLSIWRETDRSDVQISASIDGVVLEDADLLSSDNVENLSTSVTSSRDVLSVGREANTADNGLVLKSVEEINIEELWHSWVENGEPIAINFLLALWQTLQIEFS